MSGTPTFAGEIEFVDHYLPEKSFGEFENLPYMDDLHGLAGEFSNSIELMPYQKMGEQVKLLISVYLIPKRTSGTIIAVLTRDPYPKARSEFANMVKIAKQRFDTQTQLLQEFEKSSIDSAAEALNQLYQRMLDKWHA
jgi:hypothetical protein